MARASGTLPIVKDKDGLRSLLGELEPKLIDVVPDERTRRRLLMLAMVAASKEPKLFLCTKASLAFGIMWAAELGFDFSGALKQCALVPFKNGKTGQYEAVPMIEWRGYRDKALESAPLAGITVSGFFAESVRKNDDYGFIDLDETTMRPKAWHRKAQGDRGPLVGAYAAWIENGIPQVHWMWAPEIEKRRACSHGSDKPDSPWKNWPDEMWEKTVAKDAVDKRIPISYEARTAIAAAEVPEQDAGLVSFDLDVGEAGGTDLPSDEDGGASLPLGGGGDGSTA